MTLYKQGDILLLPFPFTDLSGKKQRPAVVVSGNSYNKAHPDLILAPITSQFNHNPDEIEPDHWQKAGLL
jgi:mRNA interferase MazF